MTNAKTMLIVLTAAVALFGLSTRLSRSFALPLEASSKTRAWEPPRVEDVKARTFAWLDRQKVDQPVRAKAGELWSGLPQRATGAELLERLTRTFALADRRAARLVEFCSRSRTELVPPSQAWLTDPETSPLVAGNMRLLYGRWLVHEAMFDEALQQFAELKPEEVVAPAALLFYQAVAHHKLLDKEAGLGAIDRLLDGAEQSPRRYVAIAGLMQEDLKGLEDDTLDHIARRMEDIRRRLDLGRAGKKVRKVEDGVIESLDKLIKKLEEQQKQSQSNSGSGNNIRSNSPAPDSRIIGGKGPGNVTKRKIGTKSGWGDLPPKEREEALQQIGRDFPSHYRDIIEEYFRRLAAEGSK